MGFFFVQTQKSLHVVYSHPTLPRLDHIREITLKNYLFLNNNNFK